MEQLFPRCFHRQLETACLEKKMVLILIAAPTVTLRTTRSCNLFFLALMILFRTKHFIKKTVPENQLPSFTRIQQWGSLILQTSPVCEHKTLFHQLTLFQRGQVRETQGKFSFFSRHCTKDSTRYPTGFQYSR